MSSAVDWRVLGAWGPGPALQRAAEAKWLVDGVLPAGGITWLVASPESFKTFVALDLAAAVARGDSWHGRPVKPATVVFVAAEGGENIHVRRAAADLACGQQPGPLAIVQLRPRLDEPTGLPALQALLYQATGGYASGSFPGGDPGLQFPLIARHDSLDYRLSLLTDDERAEYEHRLGDEDFDDSQFIDTAAAGHFGPIDQAIAEALCALSDAGPPRRLRDRVFLVIDTFSQTCADDTASIKRFPV